MHTLKLPKNRFLRGIYLMARRYVRHRVALQSAALAFYLLFTVFPLLIFLSALLGLLQLNTAAILRSMGELMPREIVEFTRMYLTYVAANPSPRLLVFGLVFSVYFPMRATNSLMRAVRTAYHLGPPRGLVQLVRTLAYTVMLIAAIALMLTLTTVSNRLLTWAVELGAPAFAAHLWRTLRLPLVAAAGYFALYFLYAMAQDERQPWRNIWPGTVASLICWTAFSWLYTLYVDRVARYSLLYGSIGTAIMLLVWLNMSAVTLIMGAELNGVLGDIRRERLEGTPDAEREEE